MMRELSSGGSERLYFEGIPIKEILLAWRARKVKSSMARTHPLFTDWFYGFGLGEKAGEGGGNRAAIP